MLALVYVLLVSKNICSVDFNNSIKSVNSSLKFTAISFFNCFCIQDENHVTSQFYGSLHKCVTGFPWSAIGQWVSHQFNVNVPIGRSQSISLWTTPSPPFLTLISSCVLSSWLWPLTFHPHSWPLATFPRHTLLCKSLHPKPLVTPSEF